jgi:hypothetical protein
MEERKSSEKTRDVVVPIMVGTVVLVSAGLLIWNELTAKAEPAPAPAPSPTLRPDGTWGSPQQTNPLMGPIFPAHGRILVVGGQLAAGLGYGLQVVMAEAEKLVPTIPATPEIVSVWGGQGTSTYASFAAAAAAGIPEAAQNLDGKGPPDVIVVIVGDYDAAAGPQGDILAATTALAKALAPLARDHRPNIVWVFPWAGKYAKEEAVILGPSLLLGSQGRVYPFLPDAATIPMRWVDNDPYTPTVDGFGILASQVAGILLDWWTKVGNG